MGSEYKEVSMTTMNELDLRFLRRVLDEEDGKGSAISVSDDRDDRTGVEPHTTASSALELFIKAASRRASR